MANKKFVISTATLLFLSLILIGGNIGCRAAAKGETTMPEEFQNYPDTTKVRIMMETELPDSVARFICNEALSRHTNSSIDSVNAAVLYAYMNYKGEDRVKFGKEMDEYTLSQGPRDKMRLFYLVSLNDPYRLGYRIGKDYAADIKAGKQDYKNIETEVSAMKEISKENEDKEFYDKFLIGMKTALKEASIDVASLPVKL